MMKLEQLRSETKKAIEKIEDKEVSRSDYKDWLKNDLTQHMRLQLEDMYYQWLENRDVDLAAGIETILSLEPFFVLRAGEEGDRK